MGFFRKTRQKTGGAVVRCSDARLGGGDLGSHFGSEVGDLLLDAFADDVQREAGDRGALGLEQLLDGLLAVLGLHEHLRQQRRAS